MTRKELIALVANETGKPQTVVKDIVESLLENITKELSKGDKVELFGFGNFVTSTQKGRTGIIPGSKPEKKYTTEDKQVVRFRPSTALKTAVATIK